MQDKIIIKDLEVFSFHGAMKEENILGQKFLISVELFLDTYIASVVDDLSKSINYAEVCNFIKDFMLNNTFKLIETVANRLAEKLLMKYVELDAIKIRIKKPWAPILLSIKYVAVEIERKWNTVYLSLGSNLGDKKQNIDKAIETIKYNSKCKILNIADFLETNPVGYLAQDDFLNTCIEIKTIYEPFELLRFLKKIESDLGREKTVKWGPRIIDIDIILFNDSIINTTYLTIPHIEMQNRYFVLKPLSQIAPYIKNPVLNKTVIELYKEINYN